MTQGLERINRFLEGVDRNTREITTPEGVTLDVDVASAGERLAAFCVDVFFWAAATLLLFLFLFFLIAQGLASDLAVTLILFLAFLMRNLYFIHFELATQGSTPGKRIVGLKVIDRKGSPLTAGAIVARNLTREVETFLPLGLIFSLAGARNGWMQLSYLAWILAVSALPLFNRDRLRAGDLIAGTMVIALPKRLLLNELAYAQDRFVFSRRQLEAYGAFELQVLEEILRRPASKQTTQLQQEVRRKICDKIGWSAPAPEDDALDFLRAFYTAERAHLEREQLFGKYRADKESAVAEVSRS
jgi:uncharacterized RDD family membrane protein YckC